MTHPNTVRQEAFVMHEAKPKDEDLFPRRWIVKTNVGTIKEATFRSRTEVLISFPGSTAYLMGTHEELHQAAKRVGW